MARWSEDAAALPLVPAHQRRRSRHRRRRPRRRYRLGKRDPSRLSGYPHLEEAYWFGEGVLPILRQRGRWQHPAPGSADDSVSTTPFAPTSGPAYPAAVS